MFKSTIPVNKNFITTLGSEIHDKAYKELRCQSITHITSESESILHRGSPNQVKSYLFNKVQLCLNYHLIINTPSIQYRY
jgi:uncharacterized membrane protein